MIYRERSILSISSIGFKVRIKSDWNTYFGLPYNLETSKMLFEFYLGTDIQEKYQDIYVKELIEDYKSRNII